MVSDDANRKSNTGCKILSASLSASKATQVMIKNSCVKKRLDSKVKSTIKICSDDYEKDLVDE